MRAGLREAVPPIAQTPSWLIQHQVLAYVVVAYAFTWLASLPLIFSHHDLFGIHVSKNLQPVSAFGPLVSAFFVTMAVAGQAGVRELIDRMLRWKVGAVWLLLAAVSMPLLFGVSAGLAKVGGADWPNWSDLGTVDGFPAIGIIGGWLLQFLIQGYGEETGWRGFMLPRLQDRRSALVATITLWLVWSAWHAPYFLYKERYLDLDPMSMIGFFIGILPGAIIFTWFYNSARGSILVAALIHAGVNFTLAAEASVDHAVAAVLTTIVLLWAVAVVIRYKPENLSYLPRQTSPGSY
jgi:membrane protease YdiL (CAAX protease family)